MFSIKCFQLLTAIVLCLVNWTWLIQILLQFTESSMGNLECILSNGDRILCFLQTLIKVYLMTVWSRILLNCLLGFVSLLRESLLQVLVKCRRKRIHCFCGVTELLPYRVRGRSLWYSNLHCCHFILYFSIYIFSWLSDVLQFYYYSSYSIFEIVIYMVATLFCSQHLFVIL